MIRPRWALVIVAGVAGSAGLLWWLGTSPVGAGDPAPAKAVAVPAEFKAGELRFDLDPARDGAETVALAVADRVRAGADALLPAADPQGLEELVRERVQLLIAPDFGRWRELASSAGTIPALGPDGRPSEELLSRWRDGAAGLEAAPIASAGIRVRRIAADEPIVMNVPGTMFMRPSERVGAATYPKPDPNDPMATVVEVLVPVRFRAVSGERVPATAALRCFRSGAGGAWRPFDLILYFDAQVSGGKKLQFPVF